MFGPNSSAAIADLRDYTALRPADASGWINLGQAHEGLGETFSAIDAYETALTADPTATHLYSTLAKLSYEALAAFNPDSLEFEQYLDQTVEHATTALDEYPSDTTALLYRALAYIAQNKQEHALEDLSAALVIDPAFLPASIT
ncbi:unnamed protein product, partial [marine sediment metagenome]